MDFSCYRGASQELTELLATLPAPAEQSIEDFKRTTNQGREHVSREQMEILSPQIRVQDHSIPARDGQEIEARSYRSASTPEDKRLPMYIHFHGGGFLLGTLSSEDAACARAALATDVVVLNVCYRHTPEWTYPTAWHDSEDAFEWSFANAHLFGGDPNQIVIGGISAGGQLTAALVQTKKREHAPSYRSIKGQVLMIPCLAHPDCYAPQLAQMKSPEISSYRENEFAPILPLSRMRMFCGLLFPDGPPSLEDRKFNVGNAPPDEVQGLPPATFGIAGLDPLRDEAILYAKLLAENGVATNVHLFKGVPHGFRRFGGKLTASAHWDQVLHDGIRWALNNPSPGGLFNVTVHG
ncbi:AB hydrolase superfamily [Lecanosticta acicola]|uniref:AB hydrolase superfamily n=1 Tax=Lecanosticta acicola TaxID=111012 RepID=A0AAI9EB19_9PEZI|nr:AB hydrolase superfamily [Lecanosticta acicola]